MTETVLNKIIERSISGEWGQEPGSEPVIKVIRNTNFTNEGRLDLSNVVKRSIPQRKIDIKALKYGDIIIEKSGGSPAQPVGRVVYYDQKDGEYLFSNFTSALRPKENVYPRYLFYLMFAHHKFNTTLAFQNKTTGIINLQLSRYLDTVKIPLPPLSTQKKIAAILDKADALRQNDKKILVKYDELAQSVFLEMFGDPVRNEKGWETTELGDLGKWASGGTPSRTKKEYFQGNIPWLSSGELEQIYTYNSKEKITELAVKESSAKIIQKNSLLLGMYDTAALKSTINKVECTCNQAIAFAKLDPAHSNTIFVYFLIQHARAHYMRLQRGVRQKNLNLSMVKEIQIILPPIRLQNQFAELLMQIHLQKETTQKSFQKSEELFQSLLQQAFKGELV